jgi:NADH-quinone oxidoreductase subunit L
MHALSLIVLLPFLGFLLNAALGARLGKRFVTAVGCGLPIAAAGVAAWGFSRLVSTGAPLEETAFTWAAFGGSAIEIGFWLDRLSGVMALVVTGVGSLIHVYSTGYMKEDESYARYFAYLNLFLFFMLLLVLGRSLLVLFVGWEGVGLASYLLIGFWFEDPAKAKAGKKAFIANRVGDGAFLLGMFLLYGALGTLDLGEIDRAFLIGPAPAVSASLVALLLFVGATGKSAQIPLYVWLPDAMAGPTPVSALIHAATMVTAGVYMVARLSGLYMQAPDVSQLIAIVGGATALMAATIALVQTDIKKVLAYSTVSQLGYMFLALGVGAYGVGVFHLVTHAFFKACLFLGAGSVIHALGGEQDIRKMGGLWRRIPMTFSTFAVATAAIAGIPPLAGFWSKDEILWYAFASSEGGSPVLWAVGAFTALLTAFYMFRLLWLTFFGASRLSPEVSHHVHESPLSMTSVLAVLAALSAVGGFLAVPRFLAPMLPLPAVPEQLEHLESPLLVGSVAIALAGLGAAAFMYRGGLGRGERLAGALAPLHRVLSNKYYVDELYALVLAKPLHFVSDRVFLRIGDKLLIDGALHGLARLARTFAAALSRVQTGSVHVYALLVLLGGALVLGLRWLHG